MYIHAYTLVHKLIIYISRPIHVDILSEQDLFWDISILGKLKYADLNTPFCICILAFKGIHQLFS